MAKLSALTSLKPVNSISKGEGGIRLAAGGRQLREGKAAGMMGRTFSVPRGLVGPAGVGADQLMLYPRRNGSFQDKIVRSEALRNGSLQVEDAWKAAEEQKRKRRHLRLMNELGMRTVADIGRRHNLAYWTTLPNYGSTARHVRGAKIPRGGSREPYVYLQFIIDFWDNMPNVVIFTQDDCSKMLGCSWTRAPELVPFMRNWESIYAPNIITRQNCLCRYVNEPLYGPNQRYFWHRYMSFLQTQLFNTTVSSRGAGIQWPIDAAFAVAGHVIKQQPFWLYETLLRLSVVEEQCMTTGSIM